MLTPLASQYSIDSLSFMEPPGWITAVIPALCAISTQSGKGKNASDAITAPSKENPNFVALAMACSRASTLEVCPTPLANSCWSFANTMVLDIGGGTSEIAVIALGGIVCNKSIRVAGDNFTSDIEDHMRRQHNILVGERTAESIKIEVGAAMEDIDNPPPDFAIHGRDLMSGIPKEITVSYAEIAHTVDKTIAKIEEAILATLEVTPPELSADIYRTGIYLAGGGSLLRGLDKRISLKTKLQVHVAEDPLRAVARGTGIALKNIKNFNFLLR